MDIVSFGPALTAGADTTTSLVGATALQAVHIRSETSKNVFAFIFFSF